MISLVYAILALVLALSLHLILWRYRIPKAQLKGLLIIFILVWVASTGGLVIPWFIGGHCGQVGFVGYLYFCLFFWAASFCYVITYSAVEGDSPTLSLTRHLHRLGEKGVSSQEIEEFFRQRPFIGARVRALVSDRILIEESGGYRLRSGKYLFFHTILLYRRMVFGAVGSGG